MVEVVAYLDSAMVHGTVMRRLELESTVGHWLSDWMTRNRAEEHARWLAQADNNTGGVTPVRDVIDQLHVMRILATPRVS